MNAACSGQSGCFCAHPCPEPIRSLPAGQRRRAVPGARRSSSRHSYPYAPDLEHPHGPARAHLHPAGAPRAALVLGHGAGGRGDGQPRPRPPPLRPRSPRVSRLRSSSSRIASRAGARRHPRRSSTWRGGHLLEQLGAGALNGLPLLVGGRSCGCGVACRTAAATGAVGVVCLTFPSGRREGRPRRVGSGARRRRRPDSRRPGRGRPVRDAAAVKAAHRRRRPGQPQPPHCRARARGGPRLAFATALTVRTCVRVSTRRRSCTPTSTRSTRRSSSATTPACGAGR